MKYAIGLDIGIESIGYSVLELNSEDLPFRIERLGSRIFDKAEHPKDVSFSYQRCILKADQLLYRQTGKGKDLLY